MPRANAYAQANAEIIELPLAAAQTFKDGAVVVQNADENIAEAGADPTAIYGIALHGAGVGPNTGTVLVAKATEAARFWMDGDDAPTKADRNQAYGIAKDADGIWHVDGTDTVNTRVYVHDVDLTRKLYLVSFREGNRQIAP